jgi:hypothetical protein
MNNKNISGGELHPGVVIYMLIYLSFFVYTTGSEVIE